MNVILKKSGLEQTFVESKCSNVHFIKTMKTCYGYYFVSHICAILLNSFLCSL